MADAQAATCAAKSSSSNVAKVLLITITNTTIFSRLTCVAAAPLARWLPGPAANCEKTVDEVQLGVRMPNLDVKIGLILSALSHSSGLPHFPHCKQNHQESK